MEFNINDDVKGVKRHIKRSQMRLLPKVAAKAINKTLFQIMDAEKAQMLKKLDRPNPFTQKAFKINMAKVRGKLGDIEGNIHIQPNRWKYLKWVVDGGVKTGNLGVPIKGNAKLNKYGNIAGRGKDRYVKGKKQFRATINGIDGVWQRFGGKRNPQLKLMVVFKRSLNYYPIFPFYKIADGLARNRIKGNLRKAYKRLGKR